MLTIEKYAPPVHLPMQVELMGSASEIRAFDS